MGNLNYGIIGNCQSAALISDKGSIDWCCLPNFSSASIFAKIIDKDIGGSFEILTDNDYKIKQSYIKNTNILVTSYSNKENCFEVVDFMPRYRTEINQYIAPSDCVRYIKHKYGKPNFRVKYNPKLEYAKTPVVTIINKKYIKSYTAKGEYDSVYLYTDIDKEIVLSSAQITLTDDAFFLLSYNQKIIQPTCDSVYVDLQRTKVYWLNWVEKTKKFAAYNQEIIRSALVLKLLSYDKTGAILASLTTSIPETIGEIRNWDYRFCWIRDASMVVKIMTLLSHKNIVKRYLRFIIDIIPDKNEKLQIMYGINYEKRLTESILEHLSGYENSKPVRIGNAAYKQKQHDIYGILLDVIYHQFNIFYTSMDNSEALWTLTRNVVRIVEKNWRKPDKGIWEIRSEHKHFTFSKVLCWVAIDRAIKIAELINMSDYIKIWDKLRNTIKKDILKNAWNGKLQAFTQCYGSDDLDAANLLMEAYGFIPAYDSKFISTVKAIVKELSQDGLMYRYKNNDDFGKPSSSFTICNFWLINSLYKIGEKERAKDMFERLLSYCNHLGLLSEDIDFKTKQLLGNFPQAYSHLALIETAILIGDTELSTEEKILDAIHASKNIFTQMD